MAKHARARPVLEEKDKFEKLKDQIEDTASTIDDIQRSNEEVREELEPVKESVRKQERMLQEIIEEMRAGDVSRGKMEEEEE